MIPQVVVDVLAPCAHPRLIGSQLLPGLAILKEHDARALIVAGLAIPNVGFAPVYAPASLLDELLALVPQAEPEPVPPELLEPAVVVDAVADAAVAISPIDNT